MIVEFAKYQGTGNDFIMIDDRKEVFPENDREIIARLCNRRFGIGADGLILIREIESADFNMIYYNSDGNLSTLCGNGSRCAVAFAQTLGIGGAEVKFMASDGLHDALMLNEQIVKLKMNDIESVEEHSSYFVLDTGSPHYVCFTDNVEGLKVAEEGRQIRYNERFSSEGINVNFVGRKSDRIFVRTYERGVEDETYSCGTGVVASAIASVFDLKDPDGEFVIKIDTLGGELKVFFNKSGKKIFNIWLEGPAEKIFDGSVSI